MPGILVQKTDRINDCAGPVAVRYPRGGNGNYSASDWSGPDAAVKCHREGKDITLITYGTMLDNVLEAAQLLHDQGVEAQVLRLLTMDFSQVAPLLPENAPVVVVEESAHGSGISQDLSYEIHKTSPRPVYGLDLGHRFVTHGSKPELYQHYGLDAASIANFAKEVLAP